MDKHKPGPDGVFKDGVRVYSADAHDVGLLGSAQSSLSSFRAPVLTSPSSARRMFIAAFDGTGNDAIDDPAHITNIGLLKRQVDEANHAGRADVVAGYVEGVGTQQDVIVRTFDLANGHTYDQKLEAMYSQFIRQVHEWKHQNPDVEISIASVGFSRGAEQAAGFTRLIHERGIQDWTGMRQSIGPDGTRVVEYTKPPLVPPGQTAQVVGLFDPVGTGSPRNYDRRLPPSVISGLQLTSEDERRGLFKSTSIIDMGASPDGRFLAVWVPGAHSDIGGGYHRNGLSLRSGNLMIDYLNALIDPPILRKQPEPTDPAMNVVHRSEEGMMLYRVWRKVDRRDGSGVVDELAPRTIDGKRVEGDRFNAEPRDDRLMRRFEFREVRIGPVPPPPARQHVDPRVEAPPARDATQPGDPGHVRLMQSAEAVAALDRTLGIEADPQRNLLARDRLAAYVAALSEREGMRPNRVVLADGTQAFVVEDAPSGRRLVRFDTRDAMATPVGDSLDRIGAITLARAQPAALPAQPEGLLAEQDAPRPRAAMVA